MKRLLLIRHAEPALRGVVLGQLDAPLSEAGKRQAAVSLAGVEVAAVYTSPLERARQTAAFLTAPAGPIVLPELADLCFGEWEGRTWAEIERSDAALAARKLGDWLGVAPPGGEAWSAFADRVAASLARIRRGAFPAAVVAHEAVNAVLGQRIAGHDPLRFHQEYCGVLELDAEGLDRAEPGLSGS